MKKTISRRKKGECSITKLPNGNLKMPITIGVVLMENRAELRVSLVKARVDKMYFKELVEA